MACCSPAVNGIPPFDRKSKFAKEIRRSSEFSRRIPELIALCHARASDRDCGAVSEATMRQLIDRCTENGALQIAEAFAYLGDADQAFEWLDRAYQQGDSGLLQRQS